VVSIAISGVAPIRRYLPLFVDSFMNDDVCGRTFLTVPEARPAVILWALFTVQISITSRADVIDQYEYPRRYAWVVELLHWLLRVRGIGGMELIVAGRIPWSSSSLDSVLVVAI
jgi:hypothetical protein